MTCYYPVTLYKSRSGPSANGKWPLVSLANGYRDRPQDVPCSRCIGCRLERSRQWAIRCVHESKGHSENCFLTLTYTDDQLIYGYNGATLYPRHLQLFMKRLRKKYGSGIRFFACGEYGESTRRPHYHACIFGFDFPDKKFLSQKAGNYLYHSDILDSLWGHGYCTIGEVTFESAAYVARYIMDKKLGQESDYYEKEGIEPEFIRMSRGGRKRKDGTPGEGGIGSKFYDKFTADIFPADKMVIRGNVVTKPPRYYTEKYRLTNPSEYAILLNRRKDGAAKHWREKTRERLIVREKVKLAQIGSLKRNLNTSFYRSSDKNSPSEAREKDTDDSRLCSI